MADSNAIRAGRAYVELSGDSTKLTAALNQAATKLKTFGKLVQGFGKALAAASAAVTAPLIISAKYAGSVGEQFANMAKRTGASVESLSTLGYIASQTGTSMDAVETGVKKMQKTLYDARTGLKTASDALGELGLNAQKLEAMSADKQLATIGEAMRGISNPSERAALAIAIFGRSGTELLPMMLQGSSAMGAMAQQAQRLGLVLSTVDVEAAGAFNDKLSEVWQTLKVLAFQVGVAIIPPLTALANLAENVVAPMTAWVKANREAVVWVLAAGGALATAGAAAYLFGSAIVSAVGAFTTIAAAGTFAIGAIAAGAEIIAAIAAAVLTPIGAIAAAAAVFLAEVVAVGSALAGLAAYALYARGAFDPLIRVFKTLAGDASEAFRGISQALADGNIREAVEIFWAEVQLEFARGTNAVYHYWVYLRDQIRATAPGGNL
ncbi:MAG TPA: hypothetical protein VH253_06355 [Phycisphaerae bacterium]|nr:hypothetical protein [Phycisphaerae bacterium]